MDSRRICEGQKWENVGYRESSVKLQNCHLQNIGDLFQLRYLWVALSASQYHMRSRTVRRTTIFGNIGSASNMDKKIASKYC